MRQALLTEREGQRRVFENTAFSNSEYRLYDRLRLAMATSTPRARPSLRGISSSYSTTPTMSTSGDVEVGDTVEVQGEMDGTVRFVGEVKGKKGTFVGVELSKKWAARGKNDGDVDGYV